MTKLTVVIRSIALAGVLAAAGTATTGSAEAKGARFKSMAQPAAAASSAIAVSRSAARAARASEAEKSAAGTAQSERQPEDVVSGADRARAQLAATGEVRTTVVAAAETQDLGPRQRRLPNGVICMAGC